MCLLWGKALSAASSLSLIFVFTFSHFLPVISHHSHLPCSNFSLSQSLDSPRSPAPWILWESQWRAKPFPLNLTVKPFAISGHFLHVMVKKEVRASYKLVMDCKVIDSLFCGLHCTLLEKVFTKSSSLSRALSIVLISKLNVLRYSAERRH